MLALPPLNAELLGGVALFAVASSITPGPNNMMLMTSGANFGFRRTLPHMTGVVVGFITLLLACGLGLGGLFQRFPVLHEILKWAGAAYMTWLAYKIATSKAPSTTEGSARPMTFPGAVLFQFVNVKGWAMAITVSTAYVPPQNYFGNLALVTVVVLLLNAPCVAVWTGFGVVLRRFLERPAILRTFNVVMALLLLMSLYPLFV
jgi:threonine/homoserine/homoserine lactone efflux protein